MSPIQFSSNPEISVILSTYNRANLLSKCLESVINQTYKDWEFIIVDDGSQDNTFEVVNYYLEKNSKIRYLKHQNRQAAFSRNAGIQASFGRYITFIDSDDHYKSNHLQSRLDYMKANPDVDLIQGGFITEEDVWVADYYQPGKLINIQDCVICPTLFGKRKVFFELQGFNNIIYGEDTDFWERAEKKFMTKTVKEPATYVYTRAETSISKSFSQGIGT